MSPRAAWRLESLGFDGVYDYVPGKADWFAAGLPREGTNSTLPRARDVVRADAATCVLTASVGDAAQRARSEGQASCLVLTESGVVLGRLRDLDADPEASVETAMESGPTTVRPDELLEPLVARLRARDVAEVIVTTAEGVLVGLLEPAAAEAHLAGLGPSADEDRPSCCD